MKFRLIGGVLGAVLLVAGLSAGQAEARSFTIRTDSSAVTRIGSFNTAHTRSYAPTIGEAVRVFGTPSSRFHKQGGCILKWRRLGLRIDFRNFGMGSFRVCDSDAGLAQSFSVDKPVFRTWYGLRPGMSEKRLLELHPWARWSADDDYYRDGYWLRHQYSPFGDGGEYPIVAAYVSGGRVSSLEGWIGAAGE